MISDKEILFGECSQVYGNKFNYVKNMDRGSDLDTEDDFPNLKPDSPQEVEIISGASGSDAADDLQILKINSPPEMEVISGASSLDAADDLPNFKPNSAQEVEIISGAFGSDTADDLPKLKPGNQQEVEVVSEVSVLDTTNNLSLQDNLSEINITLNSSQNPSTSTAVNSPEKNYDQEDFEKDIEFGDSINLSNLHSTASSSDKTKEQTKSRRCHKNDSNDRNKLPYFQLPKPNFEDFIKETNKNLEDKLVKIKCHKVSLSQKVASPKNFIIFDDEVRSLSAIDIFKNKFKKQTKLQPDHSSTLPNSCILLDGNQDACSQADTETPGFNRIVLRKMLQEKIEKKKDAAFKKAQEMLKLENELEFDDQSEYNETEQISFENSESMSIDDFNKTEKVKGGSLADSDNEQSYETTSIDGEKDQLYGADSESDDELVERKYKRCLKLEDDSDDESDICSVLNNCEKDDMKKIEPDNFILLSDKMDPANDDLNVHENTTSKLPVLAGEMSDTITSQRSDCTTENIASNRRVTLLEISSSAIPSYQPGGGFQIEEIEDSYSKDRDNYDQDSDDGNEDLDSQIDYPPNCSISVARLSDISQSTVVIPSNPFLDCYSENSPSVFAANLDDPPMSVDKPNMFESQELADVCSGVFNDFVSEELLEDTKYEKVNEFIDHEAELSGEDNESDDDLEYNEEEENYIIDNDAELPSDEELRDEIADLYMKRMKDDDAQRIKEVQEHFLDDGELNNDGVVRSRMFAWKNKEVENIENVHLSDSDNEDVLDDTWSALNQEKAKWMLENESAVKESTLEESVNDFSSLEVSKLKMEIIGKPEVGHASQARTSARKRPRGSLLHLDENDGNNVLKKLRSMETGSSGSRTTKHFVFRSDDITIATPTTESSKKDYVKASDSIFKDI